MPGVFVGDWNSQLLGEVLGWPRSPWGGGAVRASGAGRRKGADGTGSNGHDQG